MKNGCKTCCNGYIGGCMMYGFFAELKILDNTDYDCKKYISKERYIEMMKGSCPCKGGTTESDLD